MLFSLAFHLFLFWLPSVRWVFLDIGNSLSFVRHLSQFFRLVEEATRVCLALIFADQLLFHCGYPAKPSFLVNQLT